jgi:hypothetical protein
MMWRMVVDDVDWEKKWCFIRALVRSTIRPRSNCDNDSMRTHLRLLGLLHYSSGQPRDCFTQGHSLLELVRRGSWTSLKDGKWKNKVFFFDCLEDHSRGLMNNISEASDRLLDVFVVRGTA